MKGPMVTVAMAGAGMLMAQAAAVMDSVSEAIPGGVSPKDFTDVGAFAFLMVVFLAGLRWGQKFIENYVKDLIEAVKENTAATRGIPEKISERLDANERHMRKRLERVEVVAVSSAQSELDAIGRMEKQLSLHEMTVAGVNPKADANDPENLAMLKAKFEAYQENLRRSNEENHRCFEQMRQAIGGNA